MNNEATNGGALAVTLTIDQLRGIIRETVEDVIASSAPGKGLAAVERGETEVYDSERFVFGLDGIMRLFGVSKITAHKYRHGFLAPAVKQYGKKIVTDKAMALELFGAHHTAEQNDAHQ